MYLRTLPARLPGLQVKHRRQKQHTSVSFSHPRFSCGYLYKAGRGLTGVRTVFSKGARVAQPRQQIVCWPTAGFFSQGLVTQIKPFRRLTGLLLVLRLASGVWLQTPAVAPVLPLEYAQSVPSFSPFAGLLEPRAWWWTALQALPTYSKICAVAVRPGLPAQFARAAGTTCLLLIPLYADTRALIKLPSGQLYVVSNTVFAARGAIQLFNAKSRAAVEATQAGFWKNLGFCPQVRGTAKNPNDHPHGGRTRAIKYPRTPWGRTAKKSRSPRLLPRFKALVKRGRRQPVTFQPYWAKLGAAPEPQEPEEATLPSEAAPEES